MAVIALYVLYGKWYKSGPYSKLIRLQNLSTNTCIIYMYTTILTLICLKKKGKKEKKEIQLDIVKLNV